ncbi:type 11 methyltransferase [Leptolyngbya sp. Heron Island J]|nr:type 11 methyltransferase [Leptolyngbya sp. Heron Island J]
MSGIVGRIGGMNRAQKILRHIDKDGYGVEIGPSHNPIASKKNRYKVHIIDHMSREQLIKKYKNHGVNLDKIEEVDFVWKGESYTELTGKAKYYDWVIASHVIEHVPDLISFLNDCDAILKDDGVLSLAIPDKRYCFDHYRPISSISKVIDSHLQKRTNHTPGTVADYYLNVVHRSGKIAWDVHAEGKYGFMHASENILQKMNSVIHENAYFDLHAWCFVPHSFRLIIYDLFCLGFIPFKEVDFFRTDGCEFYITLGKKGQFPSKSRLEMLETIESELKNSKSIKQQLSTPIFRGLDVARKLKRAAISYLRD